MTDEQKYNALLKDIGELLADKDSFIEYQRFEIERLRKKLEDAEAQIADNAERFAEIAREQCAGAIQHEGGAA